jgi:hypothetical protein
MIMGFSLLGEPNAAYWAADTIGWSIYRRPETMGRHTNRDLRKRRNMQKIAKKLRQQAKRSKAPRTGDQTPAN